MTMTSAFLSPDDRAGQASASKRGASTWDARSGADEDLDRKPAARTFYGEEVADKEDFNAYETAVREDLSPMAETTKLFGKIQGGEGPKAPVGEVNFKDPNTQPTRKTSEEGDVTLFHYEGPHMEICGGRIGRGLRVCVKRRAMCQYRHLPKLNLAAGFYIKAPDGRGAQEAAYLTAHVTEE